HHEYMAQRKALASPHTSETEDAATSRPGHDANALTAFPTADEEESCFTEAQFDCLAYVLNELRKQWEQDIERAQERILQAVARCCLPGELAERNVYELRDRIIRAEEKIAGQLREAIGDDDDTTVIDLPSFIRRRADAA